MLVLVLAATMMYGPTEPQPAPAPAAVAVAPTAPADSDAEDRALKRRLAADRAERASRSVAVASSPPAAVPKQPPASATAPAAPTKKATAPARKKAAAPAAPRRTVPAQRRARPTTQAAAVPAPPADGSAASVVVSYALAQVGKRYVFGTAGPNTFDCSGLVKAAYARVGVATPHFTGTLVGRGRAVSRAELQPGDIIFPDSGHVGIYIGGNQMVHASTVRTGVKVSGFGFWRARRLL